MPEPSLNIPGNARRRAAAHSFVVALAAALAATACSGAPRWGASDLALDRDAARLFRAEGAAGAPRDPYADEIAEVPIRENMRPCCAFGTQLGVRVGPIPVPFVFLGNLVERRRIRHHVYDSGNATFGSRGAAPEILHSEGNGLVYTCRAGFIDVAHVRDYSDTALYVITSLARRMESGGHVAMPDEGAAVHIELQPISPALLRQYGRWSVAIPLGQWLAFQSSIWHEIATWFGWSTFDLFPERVSAFSPEDLYSNLVGARIAAAVISQRGSRDEFAYNRNVDRWLDRMLVQAGAVPATAAKEAMKAMDGVWWDSSRRLPDLELVRRRSFEVGTVLRPWLVPSERYGPLMRQACSEDPEPLVIENPSSMSGIEFDAQAALVVDLPPALAAQPPFSSLGSRITQKDFPVILQFIREENRRLFGEHADEPWGELGS